MVSTCCCCVPIKVGVIIIAILGIVPGLIFLANSVFFFLKDEKDYEKDKKDFYDTLKKDYSPAKAEEKAENTLKGLWGLMVGLCALAIVHILVCIVLLIGISGRKPTLVRIWVAVDIGALIVLTVGLLSGMIWAFVVDNWEFAIAILLPLVVLIVPWKGYNIFVVRQYPGVMEEEKNPTAQPTQEVSYQTQPPTQQVYYQTQPQTQVVYYQTQPQPQQQQASYQ